MSRLEFSKRTKQEALRRSGGICEAMGVVYGLPEGVRCTALLANGFEADHYPKSALDEDSNGLDNCVACCPAHHKHKTRKYDIPMQAKGKRLRRKAGPVELRKVRKKIPQRAGGWPKRTLGGNKWESR